jgi:hypothetical protein
MMRVQKKTINGAFKNYSIKQIFDLEVREIPPAGTGNFKG